MPQTPLTVHGLQSPEVHSKIELLIDNLVNIKDETGKFLLRLPDGRVIDTKGWNDWECVSHPVAVLQSLTLIQMDARHWPLRLAAIPSAPWL